MNTDPRSRPSLEPALDARLAAAVAAPGWLPRWARRRLLRQRLGGLSHRIDTVERELAGEFALAETAPAHEELAQLRALRDALARRLAELG